MATTLTSRRMRSAGICVATVTLLVFAVLPATHAYTEPAVGSTAGSISDTPAAAPFFRYTQRKGFILLAIELQAVHDEEIVLTNTTLSFRGHGVGFQHPEDRPYSLHLDFFKGIDYAESNYTVHSRNVQLVIKKHDAGPYWAHLLKDGKKMTNMAIDWNNWIREETDGVKWNDLADRKWEWWKEDEDEEDEEEESGGGGDEDDLSDLYPSLNKAKPARDDGDSDLPRGMKMATPENFNKAVRGN